MTKLANDSLVGREGSDGRGALKASGSSDAIDAVAQPDRLGVIRALHQSLKHSSSPAAGSPRTKAGNLPQPRSRKGPGKGYSGTRKGEESTDLTVKGEGCTAGTSATRGSAASTRRSA